MTPIPRDEARAAAEDVLAAPLFGYPEGRAHVLARYVLSLPDEPAAPHDPATCPQPHGCMACVVVDALAAPLPAVPSTPPAPGAWDDDTVVLAFTRWRDRAERLLARHDPDDGPRNACMTCFRQEPCAKRAEALDDLAALAALHPTEETP